MKIIRAAIMLSFILGLCASASQAQSVQTDFDRSFDFSKLKSFNFIIQQRRAADPLAQDSLNDGRIRAALEAELMANGYRRESAGRPDFALAYYVTTQSKYDVQDYGYGAPRWFARRDIRVNQYTEGTLLVDVIDPVTGQLVWRGRASGAVELKDAGKKINRSAEKLVKQFVKDGQRKGGKAS
ncbi:MAG: DUF4136 domain-containing protein [Acidobacteria bacterium]|nr:DUF4136 domain-containing protein [Acidobacteriota bacterium]